jgi:hypothetical protein
MSKIAELDMFFLAGFFPRPDSPAMTSGSAALRSSKAEQASS